MPGNKVCSPDTESAPMTTYYSHSLGIQTYQNMLILHVYVAPFQGKRERKSSCIATWHHRYWYLYAHAVSLIKIYIIRWRHRDINLFCHRKSIPLLTHFGHSFKMGKGEIDVLLLWIKLISIEYFEWIATAIPIVEKIDRKQEYEDGKSDSFQIFSMLDRSIKRYSSM